MASVDPGVIRRLDEVVVNRIAAGEIIKRPANALKEMIENCLDARATHIQISVKEGGLKCLQIQDNGTGIRREDLAIVCERFTTSKLQTFDDLSAISTYGFRGEALASISHVAHLTIQTKVRDAACGFRLAYTDGRPNGTARPIACNQGTQITVEDLFYNVPQRRQALRSTADEFARVSDVVGRYAVHNAGVAFVLRKLGDASSAALRTVAQSTHRDNIAAIYGADVARDLVEVRLAAGDSAYRAQAHGFLTNVNYGSKKSTLLLFINHRSVESSTLKTALDQIYGTYLPKGSHPFVYLSVQIDPANVDVNVHPTKHEVHFLHEDEIIDELKAMVERTLLGHNEARRFYAQTLLPGASEPAAGDAEASLNRTTAVRDEKNLVRTDSRDQKLEKFFGTATTAIASGSTIDDDDSSVAANADDTSTTPSDDLSMRGQLSQPDDPSTATFRSRRFAVARKHTRLTSILSMRQQCERQCDAQLRRLLAELTFVGVVDRRRALVQHETRLYLCDTRRLAAELFYQVLLYDFENFGCIRLADGDGLSVRALAKLALESPEAGWTAADGSLDELADSVADIFVQKADLLAEYYNVRVSDDGRLLQLPMLLAGHRPSLADLPMYVLRLATEVNWDDEAQFFESFGRETAAYYAIVSEADDDGPERMSVDGGGGWRWYVEHVCYAALKNLLLPPGRFASDRTFLQVANLANLYKVFERC